MLSRSARASTSASSTSAPRPPPPSKPHTLDTAGTQPRPPRVPYLILTGRAPPTIFASGEPEPRHTLGATLSGLHPRVNVSVPERAQLRVGCARPALRSRRAPVACDQDPRTHVTSLHLQLQSQSEPVKRDPERPSHPSVHGPK